MEGQIGADPTLISFSLVKKHLVPLILPVVGCSHRRSCSVVGEKKLQHQIGIHKQCRLGARPSPLYFFRDLVMMLRNISRKECV